MNRELWVHASGELAVTEDQRLVEFFPAERQDTTAQSILLGRVERIVPGLQAAFVDIGEARNGFLPLQEGSNTFLGERLQCGDRIPVQVKREAHGEKGAFLTRDVTLAGETLLYMPCNRYIGVSHRVQDRERLQALGQRLSGHAFGIVLRTAAQEADEAEIASELAQLQADWAQALHLAATGKPPCVLWQPASLAEQLLQDYQSRGGAILRTESDEGQWQRLRQEAHAALNRRVPLPGGGNLIVDACEALTVIDVNTASDTGERSAASTCLRTNLAACVEIARQLRLRNIGGIILIDMIDMPTEADRQSVRSALEEALQTDRMKTTVHGFTSLGLIEMTRRRTRRTLQESLQTPCPHCAGSGWIRKEEQHG